MEDYKNKYEEALERAKGMYEQGMMPEMIEYIFPELKESEEGKIKKDIIAYMRYERKSTEEEIENRFIPWLEKQCEQKPTDKAEPKFKAGDWVVPNNGEPRVFRVEERGWPDSIISGSLGNHSVNTFTLDKQYHLWTIKDAKDGDILYTSSSASHETFIFKGLSKEGNIECYCSYDSEDKYCEGKYHFIGKPSFMTHPATKEQRAILFQKMKEAGYEWDSEKKEMKSSK